MGMPVKYLAVHTLHGEPQHVLGSALQLAVCFPSQNTVSMETLLERTLKCILVVSMLNFPFFVSLAVDTEIPVHTYTRYKFISTLE